MKTIKTLIFVLLLAFPTGMVAQESDPPGEHISTASKRFRDPQPLAEGFSIRLDKVESKSKPGLVESFNLVVRYPGGTEEVFWPPPATEPHNGGSIPIRHLTILSAYASSEMSSVMLLKNAEDHWWVRWDAKAKERLPLIERVGRGIQDRYHFLDANTVEVILSGKTRIVTLKADRAGNLTKNGQPWDKNYIVYDGDRQIGHVDADQGGGVFESKNSGGWPFSSKSLRPSATENPPEPARDSAPSLPVPTPEPNVIPAASEPGVMKGAPTSAPLWPWVVGIVALAAIAWAVLKRRT